MKEILEQMVLTEIMVLLEPKEIQEQMAVTDGINGTDWSKRGTG
jgi:hypothetical protein